MTAEPAIPVDAPVEPDVALYRLIPADQCEAVDGEWRFQSAAFDNTSGTNEMSVVVGDTLEALGRVPGDLPDGTFLAGGAERWGVAVIAAGVVIKEEQEVRRTPNDIEPAHGDVVGVKGTKRRRRFKRSAVWIRQPARPAV
ncbi:MAG: hypothetical protein ACRDK0_04955 [Solirubrobacteraceae bacterium]